MSSYVSVGSDLRKVWVEGVVTRKFPGDIIQKEPLSVHLSDHAEVELRRLGPVCLGNDSFTYTLPDTPTHRRSCVWTGRHQIWVRVEGSQVGKKCGHGQSRNSFIKFRIASRRVFVVYRTLITQPRHDHLSLRSHTSPRGNITSKVFAQRKWKRKSEVREVRLMRFSRDSQG